MAEMIKTGGEIVIATDNDVAGNKLAKILANVAPAKSKISRHVPKQGKEKSHLHNKPSVAIDRFALPSSL